MKDFTHGVTVNGYTNHHCRCQPCRDAWAAAVARRKANRNPDAAPHGTTNGYWNYRCRCEPCRKAVIDYRRALRERRTATS